MFKAIQGKVVKSGKVRKNTIARYSYDGDRSVSVTTRKQPPNATKKVRKELQDSGYTQEVIDKILEYYTGNQKGKTNGERRSC